MVGKIGAGFQMSSQSRSHAGDTGLLAPVVVIPVLALIVNIGVFLLVKQGITYVIPIEIIGGFGFRLAPLAPILEAAILAFGLWRYSGDGIGRAGVAGVVIFVVRIVTAFIVGYVLKIVTAHMSDAQLTSASSAYISPFASAAASGAALLLVLAFYEPEFRSWLAWVLTLLIWAGGTVLLFYLWRNLIIADSYPWLSYGMRALGFVIIGHQFQRAMNNRGRS
jgi:hypothetical protein